MREWVCSFCLEITEGESYPDKCPACKMLKCKQCMTYLKVRGDKPKFCHGCGTINPEVTQSFSAADSIGCCYMEKEWSRRNKGSLSEGDFAISFGFSSSLPKDAVRDKSMKSSWIVKNENGKYEEVRELTPEEKEFMKT